MDKNKLIQCLKDRCDLVKEKLTNTIYSHYNEIDFIKETVTISWGEEEDVNDPYTSNDDIMNINKYTFEEILIKLNVPKEQRCCYRLEGNYISKDPEDLGNQRNPDGTLLHYDTCMSEQEFLARRKTRQDRVKELNKGGK